MSDFEQAEMLQEFAEEVFEISKEFWAVQNRSRGRHPLEISETEFLTLDVLARGSELLTVGEIQREISVLPAQMSRIIRSLENKTDGPFIQCSINPQDKRKINVKLTKLGWDAHRAYREYKLGNLQKILKNLEEHDRQEFMRVLRVIQGNLHKYS